MIKCISNLELYNLTASIKNTNNKIESVDNIYISKSNDFYERKSFNYFYMIISEDGMPWHEANLYLLSMLKKVKTSDHQSLKDIANCLNRFNVFCKTNNINYLDFSEKRLHNYPTFKYYFYINERINSGEIGISYAKKQLSVLFLFYKYVSKKYGLPNNVFGKETQQKKFIFTKFKSYISTFDTNELCEAIDRNTSKFKNEKYIEDGGFLLPLSYKDQKILINAIFNIANIEMRLIYLLALETGARKQTILTMTPDIFMTDMHKNEFGDHVINAGFGSLIDSKFNKKIDIHIPDYLHNLIHIYLLSDRRNDRLNKSPYKGQDKSSQYAFLNKNGLPYYPRKSDKETYSNDLFGGAIDDYKRNQLIPYFLKHKINIANFKFHDLRASYGMNIVNRLEKTSFTKDEIVGYAQKRMWHEYVETTLQYLNYNKNNKIRKMIQDEYEYDLWRFIKEEKYDL